MRKWGIIDGPSGVMKCICKLPALSPTVTKHRHSFHQSEKKISFLKTSQYQQLHMLLCEFMKKMSFLHQSEWRLYLTASDSDMFRWQKLYITVYKCQLPQTKQIIRDCQSLPETFHLLTGNLLVSIPN